MSDTPAAANIGEDSGSTGAAADGKQAWEARAVAPALAKHPERREAFASTSGVPVDRLYTPEDVASLDYARDLGYPGEYPFTRGIQPTMYRGRFWTMRQYAGFGTAEETNRASSSCSSRADGPLHRLRPADADGVRLRREHGRGRGGARGRGDRLARRHAHAAGRHPAGQESARR